MEQGRGPVAIALVEQGTLNQGDFVVMGTTYGKVRNLETTTGKPIKQATASTPVLITGLKSLPDFGDEFVAVKDEKQARSQSAENARNKSDSEAGSATSGGDLLRIINRSNTLTELNIVLKADVQGSLTSVVDSLKTLDTEEVAVKIVSSGVGVITESDVHSAATAKAIIYGFNVSLPASARQLASRDQVSVRLYTIIYELIEDVKNELTALLAPEIVEQTIGTLLVKGIFKITKSSVICGGEVTVGKLSIPSLARVLRGKEVIADNLEVTNLKRGPQDVKEVQLGEMCGLSFSTTERVDLQEGDKVELFTRETKIRSL